MSIHHHGDPAGPTGTFEFEVELTIAGKLYFLAGEGPGDPLHFTVETCEVYDEASDQWTPCPAPEGAQEALEAHEEAENERAWERHMERTYG